MIRLVVMLPTPSLNETERMHFHVVKRLKTRWATLLALAGAKHAPKATGRRRLTVERYSSGELDVDNLAGGAKKVVVDNLRDFGLLVDDSPAHAELVYRQTKIPRRERPYTVVQLEDLR